MLSYRVSNLDGPAIRANRFTETKKHFFIAVDRFARILPQIRNLQVLAPRSVIRKKGGSVWELSGDSRESPDLHESANRFARIA